ncbi:MAG TPA: L,D-transpeptidase, partial [Anaerolineales bacterium]|nr:L,D-transpeptidase [Anaerolineales bacterium]
KKHNVARRIDSPYSFISYTDESVVDGKRYYMIEYGGWMTANDISRIGTPSLFQGLSFNQTPERPVGWILYPTRTKHTPGFQKDDYTGREVYRYEVVQIYAVENVDGMDWYMIRPDEWVPERQDWQRFVARVIPNPTPPDGVDNGRWIEVNLFEQTVAVYDQNNLVYASLIASGIEPFWTRPGLFQIYQKLDSTLMRGSFEADRSDAYYLEDVPWTMYFDKARALHGAYWHNSFGSPRSHGCVNMSVGDARWIFDWARDGDWVYVWDPSGKTPTDPAAYGDGGA